MKRLSSSVDLKKTVDVQLEGGHVGKKIQNIYSKKIKRTCGLNKAFRYLLGVVGKLSDVYDVKLNTLRGHLYMKDSNGHFSVETPQDILVDGSNLPDAGTLHVKKKKFYWFDDFGELGGGTGKEFYMTYHVSEKESGESVAGLNLSSRSILLGSPIKSVKFITYGVNKKEALEKYKKVASYLSK